MLTSKGQRCKSFMTETDLNEFKNQLSRLRTAVESERKEIVQNVVCLCACNNTHRRTLRQDSTLLETWVTKFEAKSYDSPEIESFLAGYQNREFTRYSAKSNKDVVTALRCSPLKVPYNLGFVYAFTTPYKPGFVKIGWAVNPMKRVTEWAKCFPEATIAFQEQFEFPEQMELLIHLENAATRMQIACRRCSRGRKTLVQHDEWFQMDTAEVREIINGWKRVTSEEPLYTKEKGLSAGWEHVLPFVIDQTALGLLEARRHRTAVVKPSRQFQEQLVQETIGFSKARIGENLVSDCDSDCGKDVVELSKLLEHTNILDDVGSRGVLCWRLQ